MQRFLIPLLALGALLPQHMATAQCQKPAVPQNGFPLTESRDNLVTYTDGYQTKGDLYYPSGTAPSCGWPLVILDVPDFPVVTSFGMRSTVSGSCKQLAALGFAVWTFDCRGLGDTRTLNSTGICYDAHGPKMKFDFAEQVYYVRQTWNGIVEVLERLERDGRLPPGAAARHAPIVGFRNRIVHLYDRIDERIVFRVLTELRADLSMLLDNLLAIDLS